MTIKEIAKEVGVSVSTVSRVISDSPKISEETKKRVRDAINRLNYKPNIMARGLVNKRTKILGVVMPKESMELFKSPFFLEVMQGINSKVKELDYYIMFDFCSNEEDEYKRTKKLVESGLIDGICLMSIREDDKCVEFLEKNNIPFVIIGEPENKDKFMWVDNNNYKGTEKLVKYMFKNNKEIGFIGAEERLTVTRNRIKGYKKGCKELNINDNIYLGKHFSKLEGFKIGEKICKEGKLRQFIVSDDNLLEGFLENIEKNGYEVDEIYCFNKILLEKKWDNIVKMVDIKPKILGEKAMELLIFFLGGKLIERNIVVNMEI